MTRIFKISAVLIPSLAGFALLSTVDAQDKQAKAKQARPMGTEDGLTFFQTRCMSCHGNPNVPAATSLSAIRAMTPEQIYASLTTGNIKEQGAQFTDEEKRKIAEFIGGYRKIGGGVAVNVLF